MGEGQGSRRTWRWESGRERLMICYSSAEESSHLLNFCTHSLTGVCVCVCVVRDTRWPALEFMGSQSVCMYVCVCVCVSVCRIVTHTYIYACVYLCVTVCVCVSVCIIYTDQRCKVTNYFYSRYCN